MGFLTNILHSTIYNRACQSSLIQRAAVGSACLRESKAWRVDC
jgi:hypothetical protein